MYTFLVLDVLVDPKCPFCYNIHIDSNKEPQMTYTVQELALQYAEKLTAYYEAMQSDWSDKERAVRQARDEMYLAQNALNAACERAAELLA
jgi:hypothetical protein